MKTLLVLTIAYSIIGAMFYFNGFIAIGESFVTDVKAIEKIGNQVPLALGIGLAYLWVLVSAIKFLNRSIQIRTQLDDTKDSENLIASSKEI